MYILQICFKLRTKFEREQPTLISITTAKLDKLYHQNKLSSLTHIPVFFKLISSVVMPMGHVTTAQGSKVTDYKCECESKR